MSRRPEPLSAIALAVGLVVIGAVARDADEAVLAPPAPRPGSRPSLDPRLPREPATAGRHIAPGDLIVRYGGDVDEARRVLGSGLTWRDFERMKALGVDAVAIDCRIVPRQRDRGPNSITLEGDDRVRAALLAADACGLRAVLWPVVLASPSGPRLDGIPGLLDEARLRREQQLRVAVARRLRAPNLVALDGRIGSVERVKDVALDVSASRLRAWRGDLATTLRAEQGGGSTVHLVVLDDAEALARAAAGRSGIPEDWGLGVRVDAAPGTAPEALRSAVDGCAAATEGGARLLLLTATFEGGDGAEFAVLAEARAACAPDAALMVGTWRYGGGGLAGLAPEVWEALARR